jgi:ElaB/YqjD/DUF883 family membrane-anchored ribosome-binding protein
MDGVITNQSATTQHLAATNKNLTTLSAAFKNLKNSIADSNKSLGHEHPTSAVSNQKDMINNITNIVKARIEQALKNTTTDAGKNATDVLQNVTTAIQAAQNATTTAIQAAQNATTTAIQATNPCALSTSISSIAIDSRKTLITPQDAFLNIFVYDKNNCSVNKQVNIEVRYLGDKDKADINLKTITNIGKPAIVNTSASSEQENVATINIMPLIYNQTAISSFFF